MRWHLRAHVFIDTLHPVHEGRLFRWGYSPNESPMHEYGRTSLESLDASGPVSLDVQATDVWRRSPFYNMLLTGESLLRRRLNTDTKDDPVSFRLVSIGARSFYICFTSLEHFTGSYVQFYRQLRSNRQLGS